MRNGHEYTKVDKTTSPAIDGRHGEDDFLGAQIHALHVEQHILGHLRVARDAQHDGRANPGRDLHGWRGNLAILGSQDMKALDGREGDQQLRKEHKWEYASEAQLFVLNTTSSNTQGNTSN
jgi:hypothetical protein